MTLLLLDGSAEKPRAGLPAICPSRPHGVEQGRLVRSEAVREGLSISLKTGQGVSMLLQMLQQKVQQKLESGAPALTRPRHRHALREARGPLAARTAAPKDQPELLAEDLRLAMRAIGRITGVVDVEELLDFVFRDFCIGK
jgi:tRNA modification GTPase